MKVLKIDETYINLNHFYSFKIEKNSNQIEIKLFSVKSNQDDYIFYEPLPKLTVNREKEIYEDLNKKFEFFLKNNYSFVFNFKKELDYIFSKILKEEGLNE